MKKRGLPFAHTMVEYTNMDHNHMNAFAIIFQNNKYVFSSSDMAKRIVKHPEYHC